MSKELVISANRHETKVALIEDDQLVEVYFQRANEYSLAGSIHKGRVTRVLPGMQSAFVDVGLERDTFLYVSDFLEEHDDFDKITGDERPARGEQNRGEQNRGEQNRGEQNRGEPNRDRGRDRDRDRPRREALPQPTPALSPEAAPDVATVEPVAASASNGGSPGAVTERKDGAGDERTADPAANEPRERRGRRSRRHRRGGQGFPDSKYSSGGPAAGQSASSAEPSPEPSSSSPELSSADATPVETAQPAVTPAARVEPPPAFSRPASSAPVVLPGESLAKYRHAAPPSVIEENEYDARVPVHIAAPSMPASSAVKEPEAPLEWRTPAAEVPEPLGFHPYTDVDAVDDAVDDVIEDDERSPAVASLLDDDEDSDIQAMILGDVEGIEISPSEEAEGAPSGEENAATVPETGSASVRERGGRFPHRVSRRGRRRGGRGDRQNAVAAPPVDGEVRAETAERPELAEQSERQDGPERDRSERERPERQERNVGRPNSRPNDGQPSISDLLKEGQEIIVQIAKEPLGQKGARITSHIALPGRYVVYMPTLEHMGVSRKIASDEERLRLKRVLQAQRPGPVGGFITRTAAEGRTEEEIAGDMLFLYNLWTDIKTRADKRPAPQLLHHDLDIVQRILRDQLADSFKAIWIDNEEMYESVLGFVQRFQPALVPKVKLYTREAPIFDAFSVTGELEKALRPKVWLKSGGFIVINQTEALVAIDVNTGKYVGKTNRLEDTIVKTNTEAIKEIVRQIRLRDLGGIIVIDFIDMDERKNRQKVMQTLEEAMRVDRAPYKILQFNDFGLVAITRKRVKQSLERTLCAPCPHCEGAGYLKSPQTVVGEILIEARKLSKSIEGKDVLLRVHPDVGKVLKSNQNKFLEELEEILRRPVLIKSDPQLHHEKFDLA